MSLRVGSFLPPLPHRTAQGSARNLRGNRLTSSRVTLAVFGHSMDGCVPKNRPVFGPPVAPSRPPACSKHAIGFRGHLSHGSEKDPSRRRSAAERAQACIWASLIRATATPLSQGPPISFRAQRGAIALALRAGNRFQYELLACRLVEKRWENPRGGTLYFFAR